MDKFLKEAWLNLYGDKRTRALLDGSEKSIQDGDVRVVTKTLMTNGSLVLWNPSREQQYENRMPQTVERIRDVKKVIAPIISAEGILLPDTIANRMRVALGIKFVLAVGYDNAAITCTDIYADGFAMEDGAPLESDGFLGGGYAGKPFAHGWIYETVEKVMRRFAVSRVEVADNFNGHGHAILRFSGSFKGKPVQLALMNCRLDPGDEDHALDLVRQWGK